MIVNILSEWLHDGKNIVGTAGFLSKLLKTPESNNMYQRIKNESKEMVRRTKMEIGNSLEKELVTISTVHINRMEIH